MTPPLVTPGSIENQEQYHWTFDGRLMVVDNGSRFVRQANFNELMELNSFAVVSFDPLNTLSKMESVTELQVVPNITLGNGQPVTRYDCLNENTSATLEPLAQTILNTKANNQKNAGPNLILAQSAIQSLALDHIAGLTKVDWLLLDDLNDNAAILQNGGQQLANTLLVDVCIPFQFTHANQADFTLINHFLSDYGFRFFAFRDVKLKTDLPKDVFLEKSQFSDTLLANALFIPTDERLANTPKNELLKLGFLLHSIYHNKDTAYKMLNLVDEKLAQDYLIAEGFLWPVNHEEIEFELTESYSPDIWGKELIL